MDAYPHGAPGSGVNEKNPRDDQEKTLKLSCSKESDLEGKQTKSHSSGELAAFRFFDLGQKQNLAVSQQDYD